MPFFHLFPFFHESVAERVVDSLYGTLLVISLSLIILPLSFVPFIGLPLSFVYSAWLYSFYCFDYKWTTIHTDVLLVPPYVCLILQANN